VSRPVGRATRALRAVAGSCVLAGLLGSEVAHAEVVTLAQLEQLVRRTRPALEADAAAARAAAADVERAQSAYNPTLALRAETGLAPGHALVEVRDATTHDSYLVSGTRELSDSRAFVPAWRSELELSLRGTLYDFGRTAANVDASERKHASKQAAAAVTEQALIVAVRGAYLRWLGAFELLRLADQSAADVVARTARVQALVDEGVRPASDLSPARADEALAALERARALAGLRSSALELEQVVGSPLPSGAEPERRMLDETTLGGGAAAPDAALHALELEQSAAQAAARATEHADAPVLAGNVSAGIAAQNKTPLPAYAVGVALTVPLWDGGSSRATASAARARAAELDARRREHLDATRDAHARAKLDADNAADLLRAAQTLLAACTRRLDEAEQAYALGAGRIDAVAEARAGLRRAQTEVVLAKLASAEAALQP